MSNRLVRKLPNPVRLTGAAVLGYFARIGRWVSVLRQVRGVALHDELKLWLSALASPVTSLANPFVWQNPEPLWDLQLQSPEIGRFDVRKGTDDLWHVLPSREEKLVGELKARLSKGSVFVDAGANIGVYTVLAGKLVGPEGHVRAVEMIPPTFDILGRHLELNELHNARLINNALSDVSGETLTAIMPVGKVGMASITNEHEGMETVSYSVSTITLDEITADLDHIDLMKMDLEGAEPAALMGAGETLRKTTAIVFEANADEGKTAAILEEAGFSISAFDAKDMLAVRDLTERGANES